MTDIFLNSISQNNDNPKISNYSFQKNILVPNGLVIVSKRTIINRIEQEEQKREHFNEDNTYNSEVPITKETNFLLCKIINNPSFISSCCNRTVTTTENGKCKKQSRPSYLKSEILIQVNITDRIVNNKSFQCFVNIFDILECNR